MSRSGWEFSSLSDQEISHMSRAQPESEGASSSLIWDIEAVCFRFNHELIEGRQPRIEHYLEDTPQPKRSSLFRELLLREVLYRSRQGQSPTLQEYRQRFPQEGELLLEVFARLVVPPAEADEAFQ